MSSGIALATSHHHSRRYASASRPVSKRAQEGRQGPSDSSLLWSHCPATLLASSADQSEQRLLPHDRRRPFQPNAAPAALVDVGARITFSAINTGAIS